MNWPNDPWPWFKKRFLVPQREMTMDVFGLTERGQVRKRNEDELFMSHSPPIFMVADGLGGDQEGRLASFVAVQRVAELLKIGRLNGDWQWHSLWGPRPTTAQEVVVEAILQHAFDSAHYLIRDIVDRCKSFYSAGTTLTAALIDEANLVFAHIGDTRIYLLRGSQLRCLTEDHTAAMNLLLEGLISPDEYETHEMRNVLSRLLGGRERYPAMLGRYALEPGDILLLCSDGLYSMLSEEEIRAVLLDPQDSVARKAETLVAMADAAGGEDNITVVVVAVS